MFHNSILNYFICWIMSDEKRIQFLKYEVVQKVLIILKRVVF